MTITSLTNFKKLLTKQYRLHQVLHSQHKHNVGFREIRVPLREGEACDVFLCAVHYDRDFTGIVSDGVRLAGGGSGTDSSGGVSMDLSNGSLKLKNKALKRERKMVALAHAMAKPRGSAATKRPRRGDSESDEDDNRRKHDLKFIVGPT